MQDNVWQSQLVACACSGSIMTAGRARSGGLDCCSVPDLSSPAGPWNEWHLATMHQPCQDPSCSNLLGRSLLLAAEVTVHKLMSSAAAIWPTLPFFFLAGLRPPTVDAG